MTKHRRRRCKIDDSGHLDGYLISEFANALVRTLVHGLKHEKCSLRTFSEFSRCALMNTAISLNIFKRTMLLCHVFSLKNIESRAFFTKLPWGLQASKAASLGRYFQSSRHRQQLVNLSFSGTSLTIPRPERIKRSSCRCVLSGNPIQLCPTC